MNYLFHYIAKVISVYDADTIRADLDLGFSIIWKNQKIRLSGIDAPEIRGEEREYGLEARDKVRELILDKYVTIKTIKDRSGKYGRYLAEIYFTNDIGEEVCLNDWLVENGYAVVYEM